MDVVAVCTADRSNSLVRPREHPIYKAPPIMGFQRCCGGTGMARRGLQRRTGSAVREGLAFRSSERSVGSDGGARAWLRVVAKSLPMVTGGPVTTTGHPRNHTAIKDMCNAQLRQLREL